MQCLKLSSSLISFHLEALDPFFPAGWNYNPKIFSFKKPNTNPTVDILFVNMFDINLLIEMNRMFFTSVLKHLFIIPVGGDITRKKKLLKKQVHLCCFFHIPKYYLNTLAEVYGTNDGLLNEVADQN